MECVGAPLTWQYGPLLTSKIENSQDQSRRLSGSDFKKALEIVELSKASARHFNSPNILVSISHTKLVATAVAIRIE